MRTGEGGGGGELEKWRRRSTWAPAAVAAAAPTGQFGSLAAASRG